MEKQMQEQTQIHFPEYWDQVKVLKAFRTLGTLELYKYFGCANSTSFTRMMKPVFPNRPDKMSYSAYVLKCVSEGVFACDPIIVSTNVSDRTPVKPKWHPGMKVDKDPFEE
jgi:hypothetical protein